MFDFNGRFVNHDGELRVKWDGDEPRSSLHGMGPFYCYSVGRTEDEALQLCRDRLLAESKRKRDIWGASAVIWRKSKVIHVDGKYGCSFSCEIGGVE